MKASEIAYVVLSDNRELISCHATYDAAVAVNESDDDARYVRPATVESVPDNDDGDGAIETGQAWREDLDAIGGVEDDCNTDDSDDFYRLRIEFGNSNSFARR